MSVSEWKLLGSGAEADIYLCDGKAVKVFKSNQAMAGARQEADLQAKAHQTGLPVPEVYDVCMVDGSPAIIMEHIDGKALGEAMLNDMDNLAHYLQISVDIQMKVHEKPASNFRRQKDMLSKNISENSYLSSPQKQNLLQKLDELETGEALCHGDFHVLNLISTSNDIKIIDWTCASCGSVLADVCRTYLLYQLYRPEISEVYLELYCHSANIAKQDVQAWLPVVAGARLNENVAQQDVALLLALVDGD